MKILGVYVVEKIEIGYWGKIENIFYNIFILKNQVPASLNKGFVVP